MPPNIKQTRRRRRKRQVIEVVERKRLSKHPFTPDSDITVFIFESGLVWIGHGGEDRYHGGHLSTFAYEYKTGNSA